MPAVPEQAVAESAHTKPVDPNKGFHGSSDPDGALDTLQPAPAVIDASSHVEAHVLPRRFLGPIPETVVKSDQAIEQRRHLRQLRRAAVKKLLREEKRFGLSTEADREPSRKSRRHRFRVHRKDKLDNASNVDIDINESDSDTSSSSSDDDESSWWGPKKTKDKAKKKGKGKKKKKKVGNFTKWVGGDGFDIGREFQTTDGNPPPDPAVAGNADVENEQEVDEALEELGKRSSGPDEVDEMEHLDDEIGSTTALPGSKAHSAVSSSRASFVTANSELPTEDGSIVADRSRRSVDDGASFVTARTAPSAAVKGKGKVDILEPSTTQPKIGVDDNDADSFYADPPPPQDNTIDASPYGSEASPPRRHASSTRPLLKDSDDESALPPKSRKPRSSISSLSLKNMPRRLKSALRPEPTPQSPKKGPKTVKWTVESPQSLSKPSSPTNSKAPLPPDSPADPLEVLNRSGEEAAGTSTGAQEDATVIDNDDFLPGGIVMRDRVLVKIGRHRDESLTQFDEMTQRRDPCYRLDSMEQYLVGMTMTSVDFYIDWRFSFEEKWKGFKRLKYSIPLSPPTRLTVFSQRDMMLCLMCPWSVIRRQTVRHLNRAVQLRSKAWRKVKNSKPIESLGIEGAGLAIFILKFAERTRALDWFWYICGQLEYRLPRQIDVRVPSLSTTIRLPIPEEAASSAVNREVTINTLWKVLLSNSSHTQILHELGAVPRMELAWKGADARLDWIAYDTTVTGKNREWALLASFAQSQRGSKRAMLQIRSATHRDARVRLEDQSMMAEPPGVEGYLTWHQSGTAPKQLVYVSTNDGVVFVSPATAATPPLLPKRAGTTPADLFPELHQDFLNAEQRRMAQFIAKCTGFIDLRDVETIEMVKKTAEAAGAGDAGSPPPDSPKAGPSRNPTSNGHISSRKLVPKAGEKGERTFKVTMRGGHVVQFEAHNPAVAAQWVSRMTELVTYWTKYHRVVARADMDVTTHHGKETWSEYRLDPQAENLLDETWNWCVIDGCRAITMCGHIFVKRGKWAKFKSVYMAVTGGSIVTFRIKAAVGLQPRRHVWPLFGSYIYSGMLAQEELRETVNETAFNPSARMYQDGLRSTDGAEDTTFCVRISWPTGRFAAPSPWDQDESKDTDKIAPPPLSGEPPAILICRARSKLERDRWVWALNAEKERCARSHTHEEEALRNYGNLPRFSTILHTDGTANSQPAYRTSSAGI